MKEVNVKLLHWYSDPGHSWLSVPKSMIPKGFHITKYSYHDRFNVYLEEDVDAPSFLLEMGLLEEKIAETHTDGDSHVRNKHRYEC